ncbi:MAG TPA: tRNA lysidine(34) synthetase TilS [Candidatus Dormibacteraeota bacterium]|nr:tRNA lysidine(34) synthetase TilS [Candidatus Dormibacteraeota bacterium]
MKLSFDQKVNWPTVGKYVVAVSGGVDSVVLLHLLASSGKKYDLIPAYIDHGWRDTAVEQRLVRNLSEHLHLELQTGALKLKTKSEDEARKGRYLALEDIRKSSNALAIITAHHMDDRLETSIMNVLRGTNRYGLAPLHSTDKVIRPLLNVKKSELATYAKNHNLAWCSDPTNLDSAYRRNQVRNQLLPKLRQKNKDFDANYRHIMTEAEKLNAEIDRQLAGLTTVSRGKAELDRAELKNLSLPVARHALVFMARRADPAAELDAMTVHQAALQLKTGRLRGGRKLTSSLLITISNDKITIVSNPVKSVK